MSCRARAILRFEIQEIASDARAAQLIFAIDKLERQASQRSCSACHTLDQVGDIATRIGERVQKVRDQARQMGQRAGTDEARRALSQVDTGAGEWLAALRGLIVTAKNNQYEEAHSTLTDVLEPKAERLEEAMTTVVTQQRSVFQGIEHAQRAEVEKNFTLAIVLFVLTALVQAAGMYLVHKTNRSLQAIAGQLAETSSAVNATAGQMAQGGVELSEHSVAQASALEQTAASGQQVADAAGRASSRAVEAATMLGQVQESMADANASLSKLTVAVDASKASSSKVSRLAESIEEIAFQTNLLALNASVEAARAGNAGAGFAVVADEVRNLSIRCTEAAKNASELIEQSLRSADEGKTRVVDVHHAIAAVTGRLQELHRVMDSVRGDGVHQADSVREIAAAVATLQDRTAKIAAAAEENVAVGGELTTQSSSLRGVVERMARMLGTGVAAR